MLKHLKERLSWAVEHPKLLKQARKWMKKQKPKSLDEWFIQQHEAVFKHIDCLECANCCKTTSPIFRDVDINRLSKHLKMKPGKFIANYLWLDGDGDYVLKSAPCPFLGSDNYCSVYEHRPQACKEYPHTNRKKMYQLLNLAEKNALICPAVSQIFREAVH